ncbi:hypothetical protein SKAU_G00231800 [Synaphobranchus kaupii]|uniref:Uncharacterized protein n=1 Tax=Synaphobranchus kaupii TaxID=118154 RepID=A0A9Q1F672_SYNKA|nr:hypothetical protein SKAU_G00231800 [Synaphobranchus kaupii]
MAEPEDLLHYHPPLAVEPVTTQFNQYLPRKDKPTAYGPDYPRKQRAGHNRGRWVTEENTAYSSGGWATTDLALWGGFSPWTHEYESQSDSDVDRPEPDVLLDDLASRRFRSPSPAAPANYAIPASPVGTRAAGGLPRQQAASRQATPRQSLAYHRLGEDWAFVQCFVSSASPSPPPGRLRPSLEDVPLREALYEDSEDEGEVGYADPVQDDLYTRRVGLTLQPSKNVSYDKFLPKFWTPEEDAHIRKIKLGSQRRPWYKKMQGLRKRSASSSDDSDCDVNPWLARPSPARP